MSDNKSSSGSSSSGGGLAIAIAGGIGVALGYVVSKFIENRSQSEPRQPQHAFRTSEEEHIMRRKGVKDQQPRNFEPKEDLACIVCRGNERDIMLFPCRHLCVCVDCSEKLKKCPYCMAQIKEKKVTYVP